MGESVPCLLDFKKELGAWHSIAEGKQTAVEVAWLVHCGKGSIRSLVWRQGEWMVTSCWVQRRHWMGVKRLWGANVRQYVLSLATYLQTRNSKNLPPWACNTLCTRSLSSLLPYVFQITSAGVLAIDSGLSLLQSIFHPGVRIVRTRSKKEVMRVILWVLVKKTKLLQETKTRVMWSQFLHKHEIVRGMCFHGPPRHRW